MRPERAYSPAARASDAPDASRVLVIGCGALARELVAVIDQAGLANVDLTCLPATLHNRPGGIPAAVLAKVRAARSRYARIFVAYADCGTGGLLDLALANEGVERLPGAHCYELYAGAADFAAMTDDDPATFFLTDFLARNFDRLVIQGLGLDRHPELLGTYFGNYHRLIYLAQTDDPGLVNTARRAARRLGLAFELRPTGYGDLATSIVAAARDEAAPDPAWPQGQVASDARNSGLAGHRGPEPHQSLRDAQSPDSQHAPSAAGSQLTQEPAPRRTGRPRCVRPVQRRPGDLHAVQHLNVGGARARGSASVVSASAGAASLPMSGRR